MNIEEASKNNEDTIRISFTKNKTLFTQPQCNNGVTLNTSESTIFGKQLVQSQLAAKTTTGTDQNKTSNATAKKGCSIIPTRRLFILNRHNGSLIQLYSLKELATLDNTSKKTLLKSQNNSHANPNSNNPTTSKDVTKTTQPLHGTNPLTPMHTYNLKNIHIYPKNRRTSLVFVLPQKVRAKLK